MNHQELQSELKRFEISYIKLLHHTSLEIEKLKSFINILTCIDQKKPIPSHMNNKLNANEMKLQTIDNQNIENFELHLCHFTQQQLNETYMKQRIEFYQRSKIALIQSTSFEMDRLRQIIKYLMNKIAYKSTNNSNNISNPNTLLSWTSESESTVISPLKTENNINIINKPSIPRSSNPILLKNEYTWPEIEEHNSPKDLWLVHNNKIYDITKFLKYHPGGTNVILQIASKDQDITIALSKLNHPPIAKSIMVKHYIGNVAQLSLANQNSKWRQSFSCLKSILDDKGDLNLTNDISEISDENDMVLIWTDTFSVNIDILDKQHENLMNIINSLYNTYELKDIQELLHRWDVHCKTEETLFYYYNFDDDTQRKHIVDHKKLYHAIKDQIIDLRIKYNHEKAVCVELSDFAKGFAKMFNDHHYTYDIKYVDHLD